MWLIFAPSEKEKAEAAQGTGFNTEMPLPAESGIIADKRTAYEQARMEEKQKERRAQMHDLADLFADKEQDKETAAEDFDLLNPEAGVQPAPSYGGGGSRPKQTIRSSAAAYEDINRTLGNFYETPADDPEKEELRERIEELFSYFLVFSGEKGTEPLLEDVEGSQGLARLDARRSGRPAGKILRAGGQIYACRTRGRVAGGGNRKTGAETLTEQQGCCRPRQSGYDKRGVRPCAADGQCRVYAQPCHRTQLWV